MISTNIIYNGLVSDGANFEWQILNNNTTIGKGNIVDGKIESSVYERISVGNCIASQLHLTLWNATIDTSYPLEVQFRAVAPDDGTGSSPATSSWYTKGIFYVDTMERSLYSENIEVTAFDSMLKTETDFMPTGSYVPMTTLVAARTIATDIGVLLDDGMEDFLTNNPYTLSNAPNVGVGGTTDREMLSYIGTIYGGNWVITADNKLKLILAYESPSNTVNIGNAVSNFMASEVETVKRVKLWLDTETYYLAPTGYSEDDWLALGGRCLEIKLPFYATQALATSIYTNFSNKSYYPYKAQTAYVDPKYEVGDGITIVTSTPVTSVIASQTITVDPLASSELEFKSEEKLDSLYPYISSVERTTLYEIGQAKEAAEAAASSVGNANYREQLIYISKASGTTSVSANTTWVTNATGNQNTWTTKRPVYSSSYPVLFVATQRQSVEQSSGTDCSCTTPVVDQTTTVIDGGHITTGTIDAGVVNVTNLNANNIVAGTISDASGKNSWNLGTGQFNTKQGTIGGFTIGDTALTSGNIATSGTRGASISPTGIMFSDGSAWRVNMAQSYDIQVYKNGAWSNGVSYGISTDSSKNSAAYIRADGTVLIQAGNYDLTGQNENIWLFKNTRLTGGLTVQSSASQYVKVDSGVVTATSGLQGLFICVDNRNDNSNPSYYQGLGRGIINEFKTTSAIGLSSGSIYAQVVTLTPWTDSSGGYPMQIASSYGRLYSRVGTSTTAWGPWTSFGGSPLSLFSGTLSNTATTLSNGYSWNSLLVMGKPSGGSYATMTIPRVALTSSDTQFELADNAGYRTFKVRYDGNDVIITGVGSYGGGSITNVYGMA